MAKQNLPGLADRLRMARTALSPEPSQPTVGKVVGRSGPCIGQWELGKSEPGYVDLMKLAEFYGVSIEWLLGADSPNARATENLMVAVRGGGANSLPILSNDKVGDFGATSAEYVQASRAYGPNAFAWRVDTDAMARFVHGDLCVVERSDELKPRSMYMIRVIGSDAPTLRRCHFDQGNPIFAADAAGYPSYNGSEVEVIGRVREIIKHVLIE